MNLFWFHFFLVSAKIYWSCIIQTLSTLTNGFNEDLAELYLFKNCRLKEIQILITLSPNMANPVKPQVVKATYPNFIRC